MNFLWKGSNWQYDSTGSDNGLEPNRRQAIIWTSSLVHSLDELRKSRNYIYRIWQYVDGLRKSGDYIYRIWQYEIQSIKKLFKRKTISGK